MKYRIKSESEDEVSCARKICAFNNFNGISSLSLVLFLISIVIAAVALGLDQWSQQEVDRGRGRTTGSSTTKFQGLVKRCVQYKVSEEIMALSLPSEQLPQDGCLSNDDLECSNALSYLSSAHDVPEMSELQNTDSEDNCREVRTNLQISLSFMILGILVTFAGVVFVFPLWHRGFFLLGFLCGLLGAIFYSVTLGVFIDTDMDYAGFFSVNGQSSSGCLGTSFGLAIGSFAINLMGSLVAALAFFYKDLAKRCRSKKE